MDARDSTALVASRSERVEGSGCFYTKQSSTTGPQSAYTSQVASEHMVRRSTARIQDSAIAVKSNQQIYAESSCGPDKAVAYNVHEYEWCSQSSSVSVSLSNCLFYSEHVVQPGEPQGPSKLPVARTAPATKTRVYECRKLSQAVEYSGLLFEQNTSRCSMHVPVSNSKEMPLYIDGGLVL